jgi:arabinose-5-phosphate isomerase
MNKNSDQIIKLAQEVLTIESEEILKVSKNISNNFSDAVNEILTCCGRIVVSGMGKSGHIARKIASTFASTGTPAFFMHPGEAYHGDLGMIQSSDVLLLLSWSGETRELSDIISYFSTGGNICVRFYIVQSKNKFFCFVFIKKRKFRNFLR